jgi:SMC interacting uncharacterized protein involved in chromosome segregation
MIVVLTVMSDMDSHMIRVTWFGVVGMLGWLVSLLFRLNYCSGLCGRFDAASRGEELVASNES